MGNWGGFLAPFLKARKMKVKLNTGMAGSNFSYMPGDIADFDSQTAKRLVDSGQAEYITVTKPRSSKENGDNN